MSNGIDRAYSPAFFASYTPPVPAARESSGEIDDEAETAQQLSSTSPSAGKAGGTQKASASSSHFFGEDGLTFRDVLDAVNPLNHIPIVSGMLEEATGHKVSTGSKLLGGLMTGPVGFVASLANAVFEQGAGKGVAESMVASLSGGPADAIQVASADEKKAETELAANTLMADPVEPVDVSNTSTPSTKVASKSAPVQVALNDSDKQKTLLELYGGSVPSAHRSYKTAQMRSYFNDVKHSQVL